MTQSLPLPPGSTIGILGGGQLGRMLASAAAQLGYHTHILAPDAESVAAQSASSFTRADYHSRIVLDEMAAKCDVVTYEFENIAIDPVDYLGTKVPVHPAPAALAIGKPGAINAGLLAAAILATSDDALTERLKAWRARQTAGVAIDPE